MSLNTVTVSFTVQDAADDAETGDVTIEPTDVVTASGVTVVSQDPVVRAFSGGTCSVALVANDNSGTTPEAGFWAYRIQLPGWTAPKLYLVNFANGPTQRFDSLSPAVASTTYGPAASQGAVSSVFGRTGTVVAQTGDYTASQVSAVAKAGDTMGGKLAPKVTVLSQVAGAVAVDASLGNVFTLTLTASGWTISNPSAAVDGEIIRFRLAQDATGGRTVSWDTQYDFGTAGAPGLTATASKTDVIGFEYNAALTKWCCTGSALGF